MVTSGTYQKVHHFHSPERLTFLQDTLFRLAEEYGWRLQAWAIMSNHYHFIAISPGKSDSLRRMIGHLHTVTAEEANRQDGVAKRKVWHQYWDNHLTFPESYFARLNHVHHNPVHHRLVSEASAYSWCSAGWFEETAERSFVRMVYGFKIDRIKVWDDFDV